MTPSRHSELRTPEPRGRPTRPTRLGPVRRRLDAAKKALAVGGVVSFGAAMLLAWLSHPGQSHAQSAASSSTSQDGFSQDGLDPGALATPDAPPVVSSGTS